MNTPKAQNRGKLLVLNTGVAPKVFLFAGPVDDCRIARMRYTAYEDGSRTIEIVGDSTGIKTTLHLKMVWMQDEQGIQEDEQNPYFSDHNFDYVQTYAAEARFAEQFVRLNKMQIYASASHD